MSNIGIVCEGPTDYILLKSVIDKISGEDNRYLQLQPENDLTGVYGNGWKGVWKWCIDHVGFLERFMKEITPQLDLIVIQLDGDVARKEKEVHCVCASKECEFRGNVHPLECQKVKENQCPVILPCNKHDNSVNGYIEHLTSQITQWLQTEQGICVVIPCDSTEAWVVAAYDERQDAEEIENPWEAIISKGKAYHEIRIAGHKKRLSTYREFVNQVCDNWGKVIELCISAKQFDDKIKEWKLQKKTGESVG